jgi:hypothetical protein
MIALGGHLCEEKSGGFMVSKWTNASFCFLSWFEIVDSNTLHVR